MMEMILIWFAAGVLLAATCRLVFVCWLGGHVCASNHFADEFEDVLAPLTVSHGRPDDFPGGIVNNKFAMDE